PAFKPGLRSRWLAGRAVTSTLGRRPLGHHVFLPRSHGAKRRTRMLRGTLPAGQCLPVRLLRTLLPALAALALLAAAPASARQADGSDDTRRTVLVMGDSLSAGYGLAADEGWVSLLAARLAH